MMSRRAAEFSRAFSRRPRSTRTRLVDGGTVLVRAICGRPTETDRSQYCETFAWFIACPEPSLLDGTATSSSISQGIATITGPCPPNGDVVGETAGKSDVISRLVARLLD